jgi:hypothetical protein
MHIDSFPPAPSFSSFCPPFRKQLSRTPPRKTFNENRKRVGERSDQGGERCEFASAIANNLLEMLTVVPKARRNFAGTSVERVSRLMTFRVTSYSVLGHSQHFRSGLYGAYRVVFSWFDCLEPLVKSFLIKVSKD